MAIRLTESRLRQIIREEAARLNETNYFTPGRTTVSVARGQGRPHIDANVIMDAYSDCYAEMGSCSMEDLMAALGPVHPGFNMRAAIFSAGLGVDPDGNLYER